MNTTQSNGLHTFTALELGQFIHSIIEGIVNSDESSSKHEIPPKNFVATLVKSGNKVKVKHYRWVIETLDGPTPTVTLAHVTSQNHKDFDVILSHGGRTEVEITTPKGEVLTGAAVCVENDLYDRNTGVYFAAKRAFASRKAAERDEMLLPV